MILLIGVRKSKASITIRNMNSSYYCPYFSNNYSMSLFSLLLHGHILLGIWEPYECYAHVRVDNGWLASIYSHTLCTLKTQSKL